MSHFSSLVNMTRSCSCGHDHDSSSEEDSDDYQGTKYHIEFNGDDYTDSESEPEESEEDDGEWPTFTSEELFKQLKILFDTIVHKYSFTKLSNEEVRNCFKLIATDKSWVENVDVDFNIDPNDDEVVVNYKICLLFAVVLPYVNDCGDDNMPLVKGFMKYMYCLDPTIGTNMLRVLSRTRNIIVDCDFEFSWNESLKIPDWKLSLFLAIHQFTNKNKYMRRRFFFIQFFYMLVKYYDRFNWKNLCIEMTDMDFLLFDTLISTHLTLANTPIVSQLFINCYNIFEMDVIDKLPSLPKFIGNTSTFLVSTISPLITYDLSVIEKESGRFMSQANRQLRMLKIIHFVKMIVKRSPNTYLTFYDGLSAMLLKYICISEEKLQLECISTLIIIAERANRSYISSKRAIEQLEKLFRVDNETLRNASYLCCSKYFNNDYMFEEPTIMDSILDAFVLNQKPGNDYLQLFAAGLYHFGKTFNPKVAEIFEKMAPLLSDHAYITEISLSLSKIFSIQNLCQKLLSPLFPVLADLLRSSINEGNEPLVTIIHTLLASSLKSVKTVEDISRADELFATNNFDLCELMRFLKEKSIDVDATLLVVILDSEYIKNHRIDSNMSNKEFFARMLVNSERRDLLKVFTLLLNKQLVTTGEVLLPKEQVQQLLDRKIEKIRRSVYLTGYEQIFVYTLAHFGDFEKISEQMGEITGCNPNCFNTIYGDFTDITLVNYMEILEHNLIVRPKRICISDIENLFENIISDRFPSESTNTFLSVKIKRLTQMINHLIQLNYSDDSDDDSDDDDMEDDSDYMDEDMLNPFEYYNPFGYGMDDSDDDYDSDDFLF